MKKWIAALVVVLAAVPMARADEASKRAKAEELVTQMHMDRMMGQMMDAMKAQVEQSVKQMPEADSMTPEQKKLMTDYLEQTMQIVTDSLSWKAMEPDFVTLYMQTFTDEEIEGMLTFYKSPAGQAMLTKMPQMMTASMQIAQKRMVDIQPKLKALQDKFMKQMDATAPAKGAAPKPKS